jgi:endoplasmic reticulum-Golgi intermediate compartment protein 2
MGYAVRVGAKAVEVVTGGDDGLVAPTTVQASGARRKWAGGELRSRSKNKSISRVIQQGNGWVVDQHSPYGTPIPSPFLNGNAMGSSTPAFGPSPPSSTFGPAPSSPLHAGSLPLSNVSSPYIPMSPYMPSTLSRSASRPVSVNLSEPITRSPAAGYNHLPPTPAATNSGFGLGIMNGHESTDANGTRRASGEGSTGVKKVD